MKWTNTVEAVADVERAGAKGQWRIGDAVVKDLKENGVLKNTPQGGGPPEIENGVFSDCAEKLGEKGIEHNGRPYAGSYIRDLFEAALAFSRDERNPKYSWDAHHEAGTPANLRKAAASLKKLGKSVSIYNVRDLIKHWQDEIDAERKAELAKAKAKKDKAKDKKAKASRDKLAAKDKQGRQEAEQRRQEAIAEIDEATDAIRENSGAPPVNRDLDVDTDDVSALERWALVLGIGVHTSAMKREAKKTLDEIKKLADVLTDTEQQTIADSVNDIIAILDEINTLVKRPPKSFRTITGGRA